jgi:hypothetical protein
MCDVTGNSILLEAGNNKEASECMFANSGEAVRVFSSQLKTMNWELKTLNGGYVFFPLN